MAKSIYDFSLKNIHGQETKLSAYKGRVLLLVNVASQCGLTPQYSGLQALYDKFHAQGFEVLAFPANNFGAQEPGSNTEIADFCDSKFKVKFPMFEKLSVGGDDIHPLYKYLTTETSHPGPIKWNFHKFLVDRNGQVVANIAPQTEPSALESQIRELLS